MQKPIRILLCLLLCVFLFGCSADRQAEIDIETTATAVSSAAKATSTTKASTDAETVATTSTEKSTTKQVTKRATTIRTTAAKTTKSTSKAVSTATAKATTKAVTKTTSARSTTKTTKPTTSSKTTEQKSISCTVTIECGTILDNMGSLKAGHESYVPANGVILSSYNVTVDNGKTAYDALKKACSDNSIRLSVSGSAYGKYVSGINNIDEKDCGPRSGWTYTVNGSYPSKSSDKYTLEQNDRVVFIYTCS